MAEHPVTRAGGENPYRVLGFHTGDYRPFWNNAEHSMNQWIESVDVPIMGEFYYTGWFASDWRTATDTTGCYFAPVLQKLIVVKHRDDPEAMGYYIMSIIPSEEYVYEHGDPDHDSFRNGDVPETFSGMVIYTEPETAYIVRVDRYQEGWRFADASIFDESKELSDNGRDIMALMGYVSMDRYRPISTRANAKDEEGVCLGIFEIETVVCSGSAPGGPGGAGGPIIIIPPSPPRYDPGPPAGGGSGSVGGGGGGSTGNGNGGIPPIVIDTDKIDALFKHNITDKALLSQIERLLQKLQEDCLGSSLQKGLAGLLGSSRLGLSYDPNRAVSTFDFGAGKIILNSLESHKLLHEMFHAYQAYGETVATMNSASANLEIECLIAHYKYIERQPEGEAKERMSNDFIKKSLGGNYVSTLASWLDGQGNLVGISKPQFNSAFLSIAGGYADAFNNIQSGRSMSADYSRDFDRNFGSLIKLSEDC